MSRPTVGDLIALGSGGYSLVSNVEDFEVAGVGDKFVELTWQDPTDVVVDGTTITSWAGTQIRRKTGNYPVNEKDGVLVLDSKTRNQHQTTPYVDSGLTHGTKYYYMAFPYTDKRVITVDSSNRVNATATLKLSQAAPPTPVVSNIEFDRATVTSVSGAEVSLNGSTWYNTPRTFTGLTELTGYTAYARMKETTTHYASSTSSKTFTTIANADDLWTNIGNKFLVAGDMQAGYFGVVPASEFITGDALATLVGISAGTSQFSTEGWLKFAYQGKILFVAKKTIRHSISWDQINAANCARGAVTEKTIKNHTFKIRLMKGSNVVGDDATSQYGTASSGALNHGSEWNKLMLPIHIEAKNKTWAYPNNVGANDTAYWGIDFTDADLHTNSSAGNGSYSWCQETVYDSSFRLYRGYFGVSYSNDNTSSDTNSYRGWRPVLELVP